MPQLSRLARAAFALLLGAVATTTAATAAAASTPTDRTLTDTAAQYYGVWNYDQPNATTLNNVAVLACPSGGGQCDHALPLPLRIPQVGWVVFAPGPNGTVNGHTDQGCTWNFVVTPTGLELSSTTQQCFNQNIGSAYNITQWSVRVDGDRETESIVSTSHQPNGVDLTASMPSGSRTKVDADDGNNTFVRRFLGDYTYTPADFGTLTNVVTTDKGTAYPQQGTVRISRAWGNIITAHTPDGCAWTLAVAGNTAELDPATQTCHTAQGDSALRYWALVTDDGEHLNAFRSGSTGQPPTNADLFIGALTR